MHKKIFYYGHKVLREPVTSVEFSKFDKGRQELIDGMLELVRGENEIGLAANQIGARVAIIVINVDVRIDLDLDGKRTNPELSFPLVLFNPVIEEYSETKSIDREGCLSFPKLYLQIERPFSIVLSYDLFGEEKVSKKHQVKGFLARVIQHEVDHLNGVLFIDKVSDTKRFVIKDKLNRIKKRAAKQ